MAPPSKSYVAIVDAQVDPDSPVDTLLMTAIRDNIVHLEEWLGDGYTAAKNHDHDGVNSAQVYGVSRGTSRGTAALVIPNMPQNATRYVQSSINGGTTTEADAQYTPTELCTIKDLYVTAAAAPPAGQTFTVTLRKNGVDTAVTAQITDAGTVAYDTTHSESFGPDDLISWKCVSSATTGSTTDISISWRHVQYSNGTSGIMMFPFNVLCSGGNNQLSGIGQSSGAYLFTLVGAAMITAIRYRSSVDTYAGVIFDDGPVFLNANGSTMVGIKTLFPAGPNWFNLDGNVADAQTKRGAISIGLGAVSSGLIFFGSSSHPQATTRYLRPAFDAGEAAEADVQVAIAAGTIKNLVLVNQSTGVAGQTWTATVRKNGVDTALTVTLTGTDTIEANTMDTVTFAAGDKLSIKLVSSATTGTRHMSASVEHYN